MLWGGILVYVFRFPVCEWPYPVWFFQQTDLYSPLAANSNIPDSRIYQVAMDGGPGKATYLSTVAVILPVGGA